MTEFPDHPTMPTKCEWCDQHPVVAVGERGACADHVDEVFGEMGEALGLMLIAATEAFGEGPPDD